MGKKLLNGLKRIVIKIGTSSLTYPNHELNFRAVDNICRVISDLSNAGKEVIFVSSGAIGVGMGKLMLKYRPENIKEKQAVAAVGQCELMSIYSKFFAEYNKKVAQILLTRQVIKFETTKNNVRNTIEELLKMSIIPIVNENDTVATDELEGLNFGDNDTLSAIVAKIIKADLLIILTDTDGLFSSDPSKNADAKKIDTVEEFNDKIFRIAGSSNSNRGTGGMLTKVKAAQLANGNGIPCVVMSSQNPKRIYEIFEGKKIGTLFQCNIIK